MKAFVAAYYWCFNAFIPMAIHVGLIGGGNITETHARAARAISGIEITAVYGTNSAKVQRLCRAHGGAPYEDFGAFLAHRPMDLVIIDFSRQTENGYPATQILD